MKKQITISLLSIASFYFNPKIANAQTPWYLTGNASTNITTDFVGTTDGQPLIFRTNGSERMRILTSGYVGIGSNAPAYPLEIGNLVSAGGLSSGGNFTVGLSTDGSGAVGNQSTTKHAVFGSIYTNKDVLFTTFNGTSSDERMRIVSGGNVGIGTSSPSAILHILGINSTITENRLSGFNSSGNWFSYFNTDGSNPNVATLLRVLEPNVTGLINGFSISAEKYNGVPRYVIGTKDATDIASYTNGLERMRILSSGNVGIGTTTPDINASGSAFKTLSILGPNTSALSCGILEMATQSTDADGNIAGVLNFAASSNASTKRSIAQIVSFTQGTTATNRGGFMIFNTKPDGSTSTVERMRINNVGNVGIGITAPVTLLEVLPSTTNSSIRIGGLELQSHSINDSWLGGNVYYNNGWKYRENGYGSAIETYLGSFYLQTAPNNVSGTGATAIMTTRLFIGNTGNIGIGTTGPTHKLELSVDDAAKPATSDWTIVSDVRVKKDTSAFTDGLNVIKKIHPINYTYNGKAGLPQVPGIGVIAQAIQPIAPYTIKPFMALLDSTDTVQTELLGFNSSSLLYVVINAIKQLDSTNTALAEKDSIKDAKMQELETKDSILNLKSQNQDSIIASLQNQMNQLASLINDCCNNNGNGHGNGHGNNLMQSDTNNYKSLSSTSLTDIELSNKSTVVLFQNVPNPFAEQTTISYYLPDNIQRAQIIFFEQSGKAIKTVDLKEKGKGTLNVFANDLSKGIYMYSLIIDGQTIETKKMVKQ